jgi:thiopeptide-type bacteriocin biosynthesis protein
MPADQLKFNDSDIETAIGAVLAGESTTAVAERHHLDPTELAEATDIYRDAGRHALSRQSTSTWHQIYIQFSDWETAERTAATHLAPVLRQAEADGRISAWWFMRKHPCWRLRLRLGTAGVDLETAVTTELDRLVTAHQITAWHTGIYEAETAAFGGAPAIDIAHNLFTADSSAIMDLVSNSNLPLGRRELTVLLIETLLRDARLEWYERGDVWHRISLERPLPADVPQHKITDMSTDLRALLRADIGADGPLFGIAGKLHAASEWAGAFSAAGQALGTSAGDGTLERGLREVLSYLAIFHWNRLGLSTRTQSVLAAAAKSAVLDVLPARTRRSTTLPASLVAEREPDIRGIGT